MWNPAKMYGKSDHTCSYKFKLYSSGLSDSDLAEGYGTQHHDPAVGALVESFGLALHRDVRFSGRGKCLFLFLLLLKAEK